MLTGEVVQSVAPTRVTLKSGTVLAAHTLVWGAGLQGEPARASRSGSSSQRGNRIARRAETQPGPDIPRCSPSATSPRSPTRRRSRCCRSSARSRCSPASTPARTIARRRRRQGDRSPSSTPTRARWRRSAAARRSSRCSAARTMKGKKAQARVGRGAPRAAADRTRTARRRSSTGPARRSRTSAPAGSRVNTEKGA